jgi:hypothetical protein
MIMDHYFILRALKFNFKVLAMTSETVHRVAKEQFSISKLIWWENIKIIKATLPKYMDRWEELSTAKTATL